MAVIESLMKLFCKEITSNDRVNNAIRRISANNYQPQAGCTIEQVILNWLSHTCSALKKRLERDVQNGGTEDSVNIVKYRYVYLTKNVYIFLVFSGQTFANIGHTTCQRFSRSMRWHLFGTSNMLLLSKSCRMDRCAN